MSNFQIWVINIPSFENKNFYRHCWLRIQSIIRYSSPLKSLDSTERDCFLELENMSFIQIGHLYLKLLMSNVLSCYFEAKEWCVNPCVNFDI